MSMTTQGGMRRAATLPRRGTAGRLAGQLGWFSLGLGLLEIVAARPLARQLGMHGREDLLRLQGLREVVMGVGILTARDRRPWIIGRVAGDAVDAALLAGHAPHARPGSLALAMASVAAVTVLDLICAESLRTEEGDYAARADAVRAYATRSAFPKGLEQSRGAARDFQVPRDFRIPDALRPWNAA